MSAASRNPVILPTDILYIVTFTLGMIVFWISGHATILLPHVLNAKQAMINNLLATTSIYAVGMLILAFIVLSRHVIGTLVSTLFAVIFGALTAQIVIRLAASHVHSKQDLGLLTFALYFLYGGIYMLALALGRRLAKK